MNLSLSKTNSWHWLTGAVVVSGVISAYLWIRLVTPMNQQNARYIRSLTAQLSNLQMLDESRIEEANSRLLQTEDRRKKAAAAYAALNIEPIPESAESAFALKNRIDAALAARGLRIVANEISVGMSKGDRKEQSKTDETPDNLPKTWTATPPYRFEEFSYSVIGSFRNMFLFLWTESAKRTSYHLKNIRVKHTESGLMQMDFVLQVSHK